MNKLHGFSKSKTHGPALLVLSLLLSACADNPAPLNSERIAMRYGSYGVEVLSMRDGVRRSSLYSLDNGERVTRTYAVVKFNVPPDSSIYALIENQHARILRGASIGSTFQDTGWVVAKRSSYIGTLKVPLGSGRLQQLMQLSGTLHVAMHIYSFQIRKDSQIIDYATIIELQHPDFVDQDMLSTWYAVDPSIALSDAALMTLKKLALAGL
ncbi:MAG TPA: hypothetical protein PKK10_07210 [Woeseiaceae bacterium]|nr:hypothetical protein [Woeseiaceae bacterium]